MNQRIDEIYETYREEMARTLSIEEIDPERLADPIVFKAFARQVERLDALIELYASLIASSRN